MEYTPILALNGFVSIGQGYSQSEKDWIDKRFIDLCFSDSYWAWHLQKANTLCLKCVHNLFKQWVFEFYIKRTMNDLMMTLPRIFPFSDVVLT